MNVSPNCNSPPTATCLKMFFSRASENSSPMLNNSSTTPSSARISMASTLCTAPNAWGPSTAPANNKPATVGSRRRASTTASTVAIAAMIASSSNSGIFTLASITTPKSLTDHPVVDQPPKSHSPKNWTRLDPDCFCWSHSNDLRRMGAISLQVPGRGTAQVQWIPPPI